MRHALKLHPDSRCDAVTSIAFEAARLPAAGLSLHYFVAGTMADLRLPEATAPSPADGLWKHTCFEAFVRGGDDAAYCEINCSPSHAWAIYVFEDYRSGMRVVDEVLPPRSKTRVGAASFELSVKLALDGLPRLPSNVSWHLGLSAVMEETNGRKSYWALAHPPGKPDFHHPDCFALELPPV